MGIIAALKSFAPLIFYASMLILALRALTGRTDWAFVLLAFLLPLRNVIEKLHKFPAGNQLVDILAFSVLIGWMVSATKDKQKFIEKSFINPMAIALIVYTIVSLLMGNMYLYGNLNLDFSDPRVKDCKNFCLLPILFFLAHNTLRDRKWIWRVLIAMCLAMFFMDYYTNSQIGQFSSLLSRNKINGTFQFLGPNEVAAFYNQYTVIMIGVLFFMRNSKYRLLLLVLILGNLYCMIFLYSRAAYLGLAVGLFVLFCFRYRAFLVPFALAAMLWPVVLPQKAVQRINETIDQYGQLDDSSARRMKIWTAALTKFQENPVVGIGFGSFRNLMLDLGDTHNIYVKILVEQGIVGLLLFLGVVFSFLLEGMKLFQKGEDELSKGLGLGLVAALFVLLVNNFFGDRWTYLEVSAYLWIVGGIVARLNAMRKDPEPGLKKKEDKLTFLTAKVEPAASPEKPKKKVRYYDL